MKLKLDFGLVILFVVGLIGAATTFAAVSTASSAGAIFPEGENMLYTRVLENYRAGKILELVRAQEMLHKYFPQSPLNDNALYFRGLLEIQKNKLAESIKSFDTIAREYPLGNKRASSLLAKGVVLKKLNLNEPAHHVLEQLRGEYPESVEAYRAGVELKNLKSGKL